MASSSFPIAAAQIVALYMQCIFYGMVLITVTYGLRVLLWSRDGHLKSRARISWIMVAATIAMFVIATLEMAFGLQSNLQAFIYYTGPGGANGEFSNISNWISVMRIVDYNLQTLIGDGIMVYRCYVIYDKNWKVVSLPVLLWLAETACAWTSVYIEATLHNSGTVNEASLVPFITSSLALALALTTTTTGMIVYRILKINAGVRAASQDIIRVGGSRKLTRIVRILIESGLIYTVSVVILLCTFLASNNAQYGISDVVVQLIPISFVLILIRVEQGVGVETYTTQQSVTQKPIAFAGMSITDASQGTAVSRANFTSSQDEAYMMDSMGGRDEWKADQLASDATV